MRRVPRGLTVGAIAAATMLAILPGCSESIGDRSQEGAQSRREEQQLRDMRRQDRRDYRLTLLQDNDERWRADIEYTKSFWHESRFYVQPLPLRPGETDPCIPAAYYDSRASRDCSRVALVTEVVDGDTLRLKSGQLVRLAGIDTPEVYPRVECGGREAKRFLTTLLTGDLHSKGSRRWNLLGPLPAAVLLKPVGGHPDRDVYGRLLRTVEAIGWSPKERNYEHYRVIPIRNLGYFLLTKGTARFDDYAYTHYDTSADGRRRMNWDLDGYRYAEREARRQRLGISGSC